MSFFRINELYRYRRGYEGKIENGINKEGKPLLLAGGFLM